MREGSVASEVRTQECVALSADDEHWFLIGASPEIRGQIEAFPPLHPKGARHTPIAGVLLTNGDLDHCLGLLSLREWSRVAIYATHRVRQAFTEGNVLNRALQRYEGHSVWHTLHIGERYVLRLPDGSPSGLIVEPVAVPGKPPIYAASGADPADPEWNIGFQIEESATGTRLAYFASVGRLTAELHSAIAGADCLFFDATLWSATELIDLGLAEVNAADMAHWPVGGADGSLEQLRGIDVPQRIYIHINNSNPMLVATSGPARAVRDAGWTIAYDGLDVTL